MNLQSGSLHPRIVIACLLAVIVPILMSSVSAGGCNYDGYHQPLWHHPAGLARCEYFADRLARDFDLAAPEAVVWMYSSGYSPITSNLVGVALDESTVKSDSLVQSIGELQSLVARWTARDLNGRVFQLQARDLASRIQDLADDIEDDYYVDFLDQRETKAADIPDSSGMGPVDRLHVLVELASVRAEALRSDLKEFVEEDRSQVVTVNHLQKPNLKSMAKSVENMAGEIKDVLKKLPESPEPSQVRQQLSLQ